MYEFEPSDVWPPVAPVEWCIKVWVQNEPKTEHYFKFSRGLLNYFKISEIVEYLNSQGKPRLKKFIDEDERISTIRESLKTVVGEDKWRRMESEFLLHVAHLTKECASIVDRYVAHHLLSDPGFQDLCIDRLGPQIVPTLSSVVTLSESLERLHGHLVDLSDLGVV